VDLANALATSAGYTWTSKRLPNPASVDDVPWTEPGTVTLPGKHVATLKAMVAHGRARSVSAWIAATVAAQLAARGLTQPEDRPPG
jgi:hypothetical protein